MKECYEIRELLSFYLDNELHENDRKKVVRHLEDCSDCKAQLENMKNIIEAVGSIEEVELPENFAESLHQKLVQSSKKGALIEWTSKGRIFRWSSMAVAGFVVMFLFVNSSYFSYISVPLTKAYVNDANLEMVDKDAMASLSGAQNEKSAAPKSRLAGIFNKNTAIKAANTDNMTKNSTDIAVVTAPVQETAPTVAQDASAMPYKVPQPSKEITLLVDNTSNSVPQLINTIQSSGGKVIETAALYDGATGNPNNQRYFTVTVSKSSYDSVMSSLEKMGNVQDSNIETVNAPTDSKSLTSDSSSPRVSSPPASDSVTISLTVQQK